MRYRIVTIAYDRTVDQAAGPHVTGYEDRLAKGFGNPYVTNINHFDNHVEAIEFFDNCRGYEWIGFYERNEGRHDYKQTMHRSGLNTKVTLR